MKKTLIALGVVVLVAAGTLIFVVIPSINNKGGPGLQSLGSSTQSPGMVSWLTINGVTGDATRKDHTGQIEVVSFEWGVATPKDQATGQTSGKVQFQDFSFVKATDSTTPGLMQALATNKHYPDATLSLFRPTAQGTEEGFMKYVFTDVVLSSYKLASGDSGMDNVSFRFAGYAIEFTGAQGGNKGASTQNKP